MESVEPRVVSSHAVVMVNDYSQRPNDRAQLNLAQLDNGEVRLWISGLDAGNYENIVGPHRAADHRRSLEPVTYQPQTLSTRFMHGVYAIVNRLMV